MQHAANLYISKIITHIACFPSTNTAYSRAHPHAPTWPLIIASPILSQNKGQSLDALFAPGFINFLRYRMNVRHTREVIRGGPSLLGTYHNISYTSTLQQAPLTSSCLKHSQLLPWSLSSPSCTRRHRVLKSLIQLHFTSAQGWSHLAEQEVCDSTRNRICIKYP